VQYEGFDRGCFIPKRWPHSNIGYGIEVRATVERNPRHVDAESGQQFILRTEIERRYSQFSATSRTAHDGTVNLIPASEQPGCAQDGTIHNRFSDTGTAGWYIAKENWRHFDYFKLLGPLMKRCDSALLAVTKVEIGSHTYRSNMKSVDQVITDEFVWRKCGKSAVESNSKEQVDAALFDQLHLLLG
jgi:hypothetical protein